jgi:hypothetical protein
MSQPCGESSKAEEIGGESTQHWRIILVAMSEGLLKAGRLEIAPAWRHIPGMDALTLQLITWVSDRPRTHGEVMEAWTTTCPRMPIWEDAVRDGLVRVEGEGRMRERAVALTPRGRALLNGDA